jgi:hypothetical protein
MKKTLQNALLTGALIALLSACGGSGNADNHDQHDHGTPATDQATTNQEAATPAQDSSQTMTTAKYQCPMKCEGEERFYTEAGKCPKCNMDLA